MSAAQVNDFVICVATVNGSGSQSANSILLKSLFRMGIPVGGKNVFPSNIAGLPTWFWIRANHNGYVARRKEADIVVSLNPQTINDDTQTLKPGGVFLYNADLPFDPSKVRTDIQCLGIPFRKLADQATDSVKAKKLIANMVYVGVLGELLKIDSDCLQSALESQLGDKPAVLDSNKKAMELGAQFARENLAAIPYRAEKMQATDDQILIDGNTSGALGLMYGGAQFAAWYPITPSSSVMENFITYADKYRLDKDGKRTFAVVQAEDELASICMTVGAGWAGARAFTATSGPGVSLMGEAAGFAYFAEIPSVLWNVQRVGPSTGMPTRTAQGDILQCAYLSHGDTKHVLLFPGDSSECFEFGQTCFDLAEQLQTLVIVMSDLDLGMNLWMTPTLKAPARPLQRGKVLSAEKLGEMAQFNRYEDVDGDGIAYRTLPGTQSDKAAYFTRGSGHNFRSGYSEKSEDYKYIMDRLARKFETAKSLVPQPIIEDNGAAVGIIAFGTTNAPMSEARSLLKAQGIETDYLRVRAYPFTDDIEKFIKTHERVYVVEQNRDGQMFTLLRNELELGQHVKSIRHYDGTPITAEAIVEPILQSENGAQL